MSSQQGTLGDCAKKEHATNGAMSRACPTCDTAVIARGDTCPWCEGQLTPVAVTTHTMTVALSATTLQQHARKEPA